MDRVSLSVRDPRRAILELRELAVETLNVAVLPGTPDEMFGARCFSSDSGDELLLIGDGGLGRLFSDYGLAIPIAAPPYDQEQ